MALSGNKGEWSEIYALFKLLGDKELFLGNEEIERIKGIVYPIIQILRSESNGDFRYSIEDEIIIVSGNEETIKIPVIVFKEKALFLIQAIRSNKETTFSVPEIEDFMNSINCISLKASSSAKTDITIVIHDQRTNQQPTLGFSIKSQLGSPSTLLNAGETTNFIFKIIKGGLIKSEIERINSMVITKGKKVKTDVSGRVKAIYENGCELIFDKTQKLIFSNNLFLIDSMLPAILSHVVLNYYTSNNNRMIDFVDFITKTNPLLFDTTNKHKFYEYKIKRFLTDVALGMMPSKVWNGLYDATGGYLIVKNDGEILCYHIYNKNEFENYLLNNTKLDTAGATKHKYGKIYEKDGELYIKLNLQIRFIK